MSPASIFSPSEKNWFFGIDVAKKTLDGFSFEDMVQYLGSKSRVSEVFSRKRSLSIAMIRKLVTGLHIPAEVLLGASVM